MCWLRICCSFLCVLCDIGTYIIDINKSTYLRNVETSRTVSHTFFRYHWIAILLSLNPNWLSNWFFLKIPFFAFLLATMPSNSLPTLLRKHLGRKEEVSLLNLFSFLIRNLLAQVELSSTFDPSNTLEKGVRTVRPTSW